jgi:hypothetical protein
VARPVKRVALTAARYLVTLPERAVRALFAAAGGATQETAVLLLPRFVRRSRLYEATAKNALRIAVELVGGVEPGTNPDVEPEAPSAGRVAVKKGAGNIVELGSIAAFGFSPLWLLAAAADILNGSRVYLRTLEQELVQAGYLPPGVQFTSLDQLLGALQGATGTTARAIDLPPIELAELRQSIASLAADAKSLPTPGEMAALFNGLVRMARAEKRSLLEVSSGIGLAFLTSAKHVSRDHLVAPYREDWRPLRTEGFGAYAARVSGPYRRAISGHLDPRRETWTERAVRWLSRKARGRSS